MFGKLDLGTCFACGDSITWDEDELVRVALRDDRPVHTACFEHFRVGLNLFAAWAFGA
jgi:hypothetical protein